MADQERTLHVLDGGRPFGGTAEELVTARGKADSFDAITYVSSVDQLAWLFSLFSGVIRVLIGIGEANALAPIARMMRGDDIRAFNRLPADVRDRIVAGSVQARYAPADEMVHTKLYLPRSGARDLLAIMGSANLTKTAFGMGGRTQHEDLAIFRDGPSLGAYRLRFDGLWAHGVSCFPDDALSAWRDERRLLDPGDASAMTERLGRMLDADDSSLARLVKASSQALDQAKDIVKREPAEVTAKELSECNAVLSLVSRTNKGTYRPKRASQTRDRAVRKALEHLTLECDVATQIEYPFIVARRTDEGRTLMIGTSTKDGSPINLRPWDAPGLSAAQLDERLATIEEFCLTYHEFAAMPELADDTYLSCVYEAILYAMTSPVICDLRAAVPDQESQQLRYAPLHMLLHCPNGSTGKTVLLKALYRLLSGTTPDMRNLDYQKRWKAAFEGTQGRAQLEGWFHTGNRFPLFADEAQAYLTTNDRACDAIKRVVNGSRGSTADTYAPIICSTNKQPPKDQGALSRVKLLEINQPIDKDNALASATVDEVIGRMDDLLAREVAARVLRQVDAGTCPAWWRDQDVLGPTRRVMEGLYREARRELPPFFPRFPVNNTALRARTRWREEWQNEGNRAAFFSVSEGGGERLRVKWDRLSTQRMSRATMNEYTSGVPVRVLFGVPNDQYITFASREVFLAWIGMEKDESSEAESRPGFFSRLRGRFARARG